MVNGEFEKCRTGESWNRGIEKAMAKANGNGLFSVTLKISNEFFSE